MSIESIRHTTPHASSNVAYLVTYDVELTEIPPDAQSEQHLHTNDTIEAQPTEVADASASVLFRAPTAMLGSDKWYKLITNLYLWIRIFLLLLASFLLFLSTSFCTAQLLKAKLDLITECPEPKSREEIWKHSYDLSLKYDNNHKLNEETQYGFTDESCWTTNRVEINTKQLWYSNTYTYVKQNNMNTQFLFFVVEALCCILFILFMMITLIQDVVLIANNTFHKSLQRKYQPQQNKQQNKPQKQNQCLVSMKRLYDKYFQRDTTGWIFMKFVSEIAEITLQSQALWLYNGYNISDPNNEKDTYLANKPEFVQLFAYIIAFNAFGSGLLWLFYSLFPTYCFGFRFERLLFFVDRFSDFLYIIFPFIMLYGDDYNNNTDDFLVLLAQLNINSTLAFCATFIPLALLVIKCLILSLNAMNRMKQQYFDEWRAMTDIIQNPQKSLQQIYLDFDVMKRMDTDGKISLDLNRIEKYPDTNWIIKNMKDAKCKAILKRIIVIIMALVLIGYGLFIVIYVTIHTQNTESHCESIDHSVFYDNKGILDEDAISIENRRLLQMNPELFVWHNCIYKVYPFVNDKKYQCQCRVFVMEDWYQLRPLYANNTQYLNITQQSIINGMLQHWFMLEKFYTNGNSAPVYIHYQIDESLFNSRYMKAFEWKRATVTNISDGISYWKNLEYFALENTFAVKQLPQDLDELHNIRVFSLENVGLESIPPQICNLTQLLKIKIFGDYNIDALPDCISNLKLLKQIVFDALALKSMPMEIFNLPDLIDFSIYNSFLDYEGLLPSHININDSNSTTKWFNDNFNWNHNAIYWLQSNPICDYVYNDSNSIPLKLREFLVSNASKCDTPCNTGNALATFCQPRWYGDGVCDSECNIPVCAFDGGDCVQLCFSELTNCTWDLFTNDECDQECDNQYCTGYLWKSDFSTAYVKYQQFSNYTAAFAADNTECDGYEKDVDFDVVECANSVSPYLEIPSTVKVQFISTYLFNTTDEVDFSCDEFDVDNGLCYDQCRTEQCLYDGNDCNLGCIYDFCEDIYTLWLFLAGASTYIVSHDIVCSEWLTKNEWISWDIGNDPNLCELLMYFIDFDDDKHMNFREFTFLILALLDGDGVLGVSQTIGANCSSCMGPNYNIQFV